MRINYKHLAIGGLALNFMLAMSPSQAAKQRMVCPSDGKRPMFNIICPGGEEPIPIEKYENKSRPPSDSGSKSRRNCSRMPNGKVSAECDSPVIVTKTSRQDFEPEMVSIPAGETKLVYNIDNHLLESVANFEIGKYPITRKQYEYIMGSELLSNADCQDCPVQITFENALEYLSKLNEKTTMVYRLPTQAEWLHACINIHNMGNSFSEMTQPYSDSENIIHVTVGECLQISGHLCIASHGATCRIDHLKLENNICIIEDHSSKCVYIAGLRLVKSN